MHLSLNLTKRFRSFIHTLAWMVVIAAVVGNASHASSGRNKRQEQSEEVLITDFLPACLADESNLTINWQGVFAIAFDTRWYLELATRCTLFQPNLTLVFECMIQGTNLLFHRNSPLLEHTKTCFIAYSFAINVNYTGSRFPSNETAEVSDNPLCPNVSVSDVISIYQETYPFFFQNDILTSMVGNLETFLNLFRNEMICPNCTCEDLSENAGTLVRYQFENSTLECNQCWFSRLGAVLRSASLFARVAGVTAIRVGGLREVADNCTGEYVKVSNPQFKTMLDPQVTCSADNINIRLNRCALVNIGLDFIYEVVIADRNDMFTNPTFLPPNCEPTLYGNPTFDMVEFVIRDNLDTCGVDQEVNESHILYTYVLRLRPNRALNTEIISRLGDFCMEITCAYQKNYSVSFDIPLVPLIGKTELQLDGGIGRFKTEMTLYRDDDFEQLFMLQGENFPSVDVPDYIYVDISLVNSVQNIRLVVQRCMASNTNPLNTNQKGTYRLITHRCPEDPLLQVINEDRDQYRFAFPSFFWIDDSLDQLIFIICELRVCDLSTNNCEESDCDKRRKRSTRGDDETYKELRVGPLRLSPNSPCYKDNGGCSHKCITLKNGHRCECREGYELLEDGRNCVDQSTLIHQQSLDAYRLEPNDSTFETTASLDFAVVLAIGFLFFVLMFVVLLFAYKRVKFSVAVKHAAPLKSKTRIQCG